MWTELNCGIHLLASSQAALCLEKEVLVLLCNYRTLVHGGQFSQLALMLFQGTDVCKDGKNMG